MNTRRQFVAQSVKSLAALTAVSMLAPLIARAAEKSKSAAAKAKGACKDLIDLSGKGNTPKSAVAMATSLKYVPDVQKAIKDGKMKKSQLRDPKANCSNCQLYTKANSECGKCTLFQGVSVHAKGWCMSWAPKAKS